MGRILRQYFADFGLLLKLPREFWGAQALNFAYCAFYFTFVTISALHLSQDVGFSDEGAGLLFGVFMFGTAILQILLGPVVDRLGFRRTPLAAATIVAVSAVGMGGTPLLLAATGKARVFEVLFYLVAMVGNGLMFPVLTAAVKRYSNSETRGAGFNMWYLTMNVGAMLTFVIDLMRRNPGENATADQIAAFRAAGGNAHLMWYLCGLVILCAFIVYFTIRSEAQFPEFRIGKEPAPAKTTSPSTSQPLTQTIVEIFQDRAFRKVLLLLFCTIPAHMPFVAAFVVYPKYYTRVIAADVNLGSLASLNPIIIIIGLILFAPLLKRFNVYWVLVVGMLIAGASSLALAIPPQIIGSFVGTTNVGSIYLMMVGVQIVVFAIGEFIWSPQLQAYVGSIAPVGKEGTYMGVTRYPYTLAKLLGGAGGGYLLAHYCPEGVKATIEAGTLGYFDSPEMMNLVLALFALSSPVALLIMKSRFYVDTKATDK